MAAVVDVHNPLDWFFLFKLIGGFTANFDLQYVLRALEERGDDIRRNVGDLATEFRPEYRFFTGPENNYLAIAGLRHYSNPSNLVGSGLSYDTHQQATQALYIFDAQADYLMEQYRLLYGYAISNLTITGHSWGGAVGVVFAKKFKALYPDCNVQIISFGSPRPGSQAFCRSLVPLPWSRIVVLGDVVPNILPHSWEAPTMHGFVTNEQSRRINSLRQGGTPYLLMGGGNYTSDVDEEGPVLTTEVGIVNWVGRVFSQNDVVHSYRPYWTQLLQHDSIRRRDDMRLVAASRVRRVPGQTIEETPAQRHAAVVAAQQSLVQPSPQRGNDFQGRLFYSKKVGKRWDVLLGSDPVATFRTGSQARRYVRAGNRFLRQQQRASRVYSTSLGGGLTNWLTDSAAEGSALRPPVRLEK